jgi:TolB-like protein
VFLSYASEDRSAAQVLRDALPSHGVEVWYDETDLAGGDAWDQKIRQQIRECDFFIPVISAQTEARHEGYFRREWRLAVERSLDMADDHLFLLPVVIDETPQGSARVPEKFLAVQWTRVPGGQPNPALETLCRRILAGDVRPPRGPARTHPPAGTGAPPPLTPTLDEDADFEPNPASGARAAVLRPLSPLPPFPQEVGRHQQVRYAIEVVVWVVDCGWRVFKRLPRLWQVVATIWLITTLVSTSCSHRDAEVHLSAADARKLQALENKYHGDTPADVASYASQIQRTVAAAAAAGGAAPGPSRHTPLLAVPFTAPAGDAEARKLANATFAQVYGQLALSHHGLVGLLVEPLTSTDDKTVLERARSRSASYVLLGAVNGAGPSLTIRILKVDGGIEAWSKEYTSKDTDAAAIASEVDDRVHAHVDD